MTRPLADRYTFGQAYVPAAFSAETELVYDVPRNIRALTTLARAQVDRQEEAAKRIADSAERGAMAVASEIRTASTSMNRLLENISDTISTGLDRVWDSVTQLQTAVCHELQGLRWESAQQTKLLADILEVLQQRRKAEAHELVRQGTRLLANDRIDDALEVFSSAWALDRTDYQVLMNLGHVHVQVGDAEAARRHFQDSIKLPDALPPTALAFSLWSLARLEYAEGNYKAALDHAEKAFSLKTRQERVRFSIDLAAYQAAAGKTRHALSSVRSALDEQPKLTPLVLAHPDLESLQPAIEQMLISMAAKCLDKCESEVRTAESELADVETWPDSIRDLGNRLSARVAQERELIAKTSITECRRSLLRLKELADLSQGLHNLRSRVDDLTAAEQCRDQAVSKTQELGKPSGDRAIDWGFLWIPMYVLPGIVFATMAYVYDFRNQDTDCFLAYILGVLIWPLALLLPLADKPEQMPYFRMAVGCLILALVLGLAFALAVARAVRRDQRKNEAIKTAQAAVFEAQNVATPLRREFDAALSAISGRLRQL